MQDALRFNSAARGILPLYLNMTQANRLKKSQRTDADGIIATKIVAETLAGSLPKIYAKAMRITEIKAKVDVSATASDFEVFLVFALFIRSPFLRPF